MIFPDIKLIVSVAIALVLGLVLGNIRGEWVGSARGYATCQTQNANATIKKNRYVLEEQDKLARVEEEEDASSDKARLALNETPIDNDTCRALTERERDALAAIGGNNTP